jgi:hypothetical protein
MSLNEIANIEWQPRLWTYTQPAQTIFDELGLSEAQIQQQAPQLSNLPIEDLRERVGIFSIAAEIRTLTPETTIEFLTLNKARLSQLATLVDVDTYGLPEDTLIDIASSPIGINAEILIRHITHTLEQNPENGFLLGRLEEQLLLSALKYSKEQKDIDNQNRIQEVLTIVRKCSEKKNLNRDHFSQPALGLEIV